MPIYQYRCSACGEEVELKQGYSDTPLKVCGKCGGEVKKVFSPIGISFKGSGFHRNDVRTETEAKSKNAKARVEPKAKAETVSHPAKV